jgi:indolepyruvate ferredoxin oxidoreductase
LETELGRKRTIDQSACNRDFSCLQGFCPSFVTVSNSKPRRRLRDDGAVPPEPAAAPCAVPYNVLVAGIGGTGVVTASKLIALAAHLERKAVRGLDQTGLAQKFGAVLSHVRIADSDSALHGARIPEHAADVLLGCDLMVAAGEASVTRLSKARSTVVANTNEELPPEFIHDRDIEYPLQSLLATLHEAAGAGAVHAVDATGVAQALLDDALAANILLLGVALQHGLLPVSAAALERAIEVLGIDVPRNRRALLLGRQIAWNSVAAPAASSGKPGRAPRFDSLGDIVEHRKGLLGDYQNAVYAARYEHWVDRVRRRETGVRPGSVELSKAVARAYFKLLAYKDEYEVARLFTQAGFLERLKDEFEGDLRLTFHMAPPLLAGTDTATGLPRKHAFGGWILPLLRMLAGLRFLRGGPLDIFGYSTERRLERRLIRDYEDLMSRFELELDEPRFELALQLARLPEQIRGFGPIKFRATESARAEWAELLLAWEHRGRVGVSAG